MNTLVILFRHGNTFEKGERAYMVGANEDLPLTAFGIEQGRAVGEALKGAGVQPERIVCGPLKRTKVFAQQIAEVTGFAKVLEEERRLTEFDYGAWSALTNEEIVTLSGQEALARWQDESIRPSQVTFSPSESQARLEAEGVLNDLAGTQRCCVVVTSNGRLREFGRIAHGAKGQSFKVKTGHACVLMHEGQGWRVLGWDLSPDALKPLLESVVV